MKPATDDEPAVHESRLRIVASVTTVAIYLQVLVGAMMRHTAAGLAIPDFPLVFGGLLPPEWTPGIAVHFAHRVGALLVASAVVATAGHIWYHHRWRHDLTWPATMAVLLVLVQIALGGLTVLSRRAVSINTAHVVTGALLLATSLVISLRSWRERFVGTTDVDVEAGLKTRLCQADGVSRRSSVGARA